MHAIDASKVAMIGLQPTVAILPSLLISYRP
jgi:hypothetical protein